MKRQTSAEGMDIHNRSLIAAISSIKNMTSPGQPDQEHRISAKSHADWYHRKRSKNHQTIHIASPLQFIAQHGVIHVMQYQPPNIPLHGPILIISL